MSKKIKKEGDISTIDIAEIVTSERVIEIVHPKTKDELGISVTVLSVNDPAMERIKRKITNEKLRLQARGKNFKAEDLDDNLDMILFSAMTSWEWRGEVSFNGEKPQFNQRNVLAVFGKLNWFRDQINEGVSDEEAFF